MISQVAVDPKVNEAQARPLPHILILTQFIVMIKHCEGIDKSAKVENKSSCADGKDDLSINIKREIAFSDINQLDLPDEIIKGIFDPIKNRL